MPLAQEENDTEAWLSCDRQFNKLYPRSIQLLADRHWTPLQIAREAAGFLTPLDGSRILDIGSGVGKFCLVAASLYPTSTYYGVEQRMGLIKHAEAAKNKLLLKNVSFIQGNFTQLDFRDYDHFYFYNSFYENLDGRDMIDDNIEYSLELFNYYNQYMYRQLEKKPLGTRLVTYHSLESEIPRDFHLISSSESDILKCWIKG